MGERHCKSVFNFTSSISSSFKPNSSSLPSKNISFSSSSGPSLSSSSSTESNESLAISILYYLYFIKIIYILYIILFCLYCVKIIVKFIECKLLKKYATVHFLYNYFLCCLETPILQQAVLLLSVCMSFNALLQGMMQPIFCSFSFYAFKRLR